MTLPKCIFYLVFLFCLPFSLPAQEAPATLRKLSLEEYQQAKTFSIANLDTDSYLKIENTYILDRYEMKKPYFITGDDGLRKRMDLYKLIAKEGLQELGLMIYYTNEQDKRYQLLLPGLAADPAVWEHYFEDVHAIDKQEKDFALKLSYVLSKELSYQQYKAVQDSQHLPPASATYGSDICFPGHQLVRMANGSDKPLSSLQAGEQVLVIDPASHQPKTVVVAKLVTHAPKHYAITQLWVVADSKTETGQGQEILLRHKVVEATPNHPMLTTEGPKRMAALALGDVVLCADAITGKLLPYQLLIKRDMAGDEQAVYSLETQEGTTLLMNGVMVLQK